MRFCGGNQFPTSTAMELSNPFSNAKTPQQKKEVRMQLIHPLAYLIGLTRVDVASESLSGSCGGRGGSIVCEGRGARRGGNGPEQ